MRTQKAEVLAEFTFPGIEWVHGVTHDGARAWIALGDRLQSVEADGSFGRTLSVRAEAGSAFDGRHFYQIAAGTIQKVDPATGAVVATVPAPPDTDYAGLTWAEGALWVGQYEGRRILKLDPKTGRVLRTVQSDRLVTGVTFAEGELWHGAVQADRAELRRVAPDSGEVREALEMPDAFVSGLEYDGKGRFYAGTGKSGRLRVLRRPKG
ncbi:MAG TPA: glutamine cyclotransferase [Polyangiaceae bacterium]|jgi:outer membrane protein assembly factor BamB